MLLDTPNAAATLADSQTRVRRFLYALVIAVAAAQGLTSILTTTVLYSPARWPENKPPALPMFSANDRSRWCTVWSLAEQGTYRIDDIIAVPGWDTIDKVRHDGHFYSSKPALPPTLIAGVYWTLKQATGLDLLKQTHETVHLILLLVNLLPWVVALGVLAAVGERYGRTDWSRMYLVVAAAFGTLLTTFLVTLNNHTVAAVSVVFAIYPVLRILIDGRRAWWQFALAGFWGAFAACNELPAAAFGAGLFALLAYRVPGPTLKFFVPAALVPLAGFLATTYASTGSWLPFYAAYGSEAYKYVIDGVPSYWLEPSGIDRNLDSPQNYFLHCTIGHHGIFSLTPVFLLTLAGWLFLRRWRSSPLREICWFSLGLTVIVLGFYLTRTGNYNYGGVSSGLRWTFWLIPLWLITLIPVLDEWGGRRWFRVTSALFLLISVFSATYPHNNPWQAPWLQTALEQWGWTPGYGQPIEPFPTPRRSWIGNLPAAPSPQDQPWVEFEGVGSQGRSARLRVASLHRTLSAGRREIEVTHDPGDNAQRDPLHLDLIVMEEPFTRGAAPYLCIISPTGADRPAWDAAVRFLNGLPAGGEYKAGSWRYLKTALRTDAFRCRLATAHIHFRAKPEDPPLNYRRTVWLTNEIPFGVAQIEDTVTDPRDNAVVFKQRFTAAGASHLQSKSNP